MYARVDETIRPEAYTFLEDYLSDLASSSWVDFRTVIHRDVAEWHALDITTPEQAHAAINADHRAESVCDLVYVYEDGASREIYAYSDL